MVDIFVTKLWKWFRQAQVVLQRSPELVVSLFVGVFHLIKRVKEDLELVRMDSELVPRASDKFRQLSTGHGCFSKLLEEDFKASSSYRNSFPRMLTSQDLFKGRNLLVKVTLVDLSDTVVVKALQHENRMADPNNELGIRGVLFHSGDGFVIVDGSRALEASLDIG